MSRLFNILAVVLTLCLGWPVLAAPAPATVVADMISIDGQGNLVAQGNIEVFYNGATLQASKIIYDRAADDLDIIGPLVLVDEQGNRLSADRGMLSRDLQNGILTSARLLLDNQLDLRAQSIARQEGRFSDLNQVALTSCKTCDGRPPLWQIRAATVRHDTQQKQIYMTNAQLRLWGIPVFYVPWLRVPDPSLDRAQGFLEPTIKSTSLLGSGLKLPYFIPIGQDKDVTLTPYISSVTNTLEIDYRQAFHSGSLTAAIRLSQDSIESDGTRAHGKIWGDFKLPREFKLNFSIEAVSDNRYLGDYYDDTRDQVRSSVSIAKTDAATHREVNLYHYKALYDEDSTDPSVLTYSRIEHVVPRLILGHPLTLSAEAMYSHRNSTLAPIGRDTGRINSAFVWSARETAPIGLRLGLDVQGRADLFFTAQDDNYQDRILSLTTDVMGQVRWPWVGQLGTTTTLIEPVFQIGYGIRDKNNFPNEESTSTEFDPGNLLSLSRFPAPDRYERGLRAAWGLNMNLENANEVKFGGTLGQVIRDKSLNDFSDSSGLQGTRSDLLIAGHISDGNKFSVTARSLRNSELKAIKSELRGQYHGKRFTLDGGYSNLESDVQENRLQSVQEWTIASSYKMNKRWTISNDFRFDLDAKRFATAGLGLAYDAQCANIDFSVSRRFTESGTSPPQTTFALGLRLKGFGTGRSTTQSQPSCGG